MAVDEPPEDNMKKQKEEFGEISIETRFTLYRGLGLPEEAIKTYREFLKTEERFHFTSFMSTSTDKNIALEFAYMG